MLGARRPRQPAPPPPLSSPGPGYPVPAAGERGLAAPPLGTDGRAGGQTDAAPVMMRTGGWWWWWWGGLRSGQPPQPPPHLSLSPLPSLLQGGRSGGEEKFGRRVPAQRWPRPAPGAGRRLQPRGAGLPPPRAGSGAGADRERLLRSESSAGAASKRPLLKLKAAAPAPGCAPPFQAPPGREPATCEARGEPGSGWAQLVAPRPRPRQAGRRAS